MQVSRAYFNKCYSLAVLDWPTYRDARQARNRAVIQIQHNYAVDMGDLAALLSHRLGCLPGRLVLRTDVEPQEWPLKFEGLYGSLERRLDERLDRLTRDEKVRPYTVTTIARKDGLPTDIMSLHHLGRLLRKAIGEPPKGPNPVWRLPEDIFIGARFRD